jgi:hypothetical protein
MFRRTRWTIEVETWKVKGVQLGGVAVLLQNSGGRFIFGVVFFVSPVIVSEFFWEDRRGRNEDRRVYFHDILAGSDVVRR